MDRMQFDPINLNPYRHASLEDPEIEGLFDMEKDRTIVTQLLRNWMDERHAPDILPFQGAIVEEALQKLSEQARSMYEKVVY